MSTAEWNEHHHRVVIVVVVVGEQHRGFEPFLIAKFAIDSDDSFPFFKCSILILLHLHIAFGISSHHSKHTYAWSESNFEYILNAIYSHIPFICRCQCLCIVDSLCVLHNEMKYKLNHFLGEMKLFLLVFIIDVQIISVGCFRSPKIRKLNEKRSFIFKIQCKKEIKSTIRIRQVKRCSSFMCVCVSIRLRVLNCRKSVVIYWKRKKFI